MGKGSSSGSSNAVVTPEQTQQNQLTNKLLTDYIPVLQNTLSGASNTYNANAQNIANQSTNVQQQAGGIAKASNDLGTVSTTLADRFGTTALNNVNQGAAGTNQAANALGQIGAGNALTGSQNLQGLFSPQYEASQVQASLQPAMEAAREAALAQSSSYGGAGGAGSARNALANANMNSLNQQRFQNAAATTQAAIEGQRQAVGTTQLTQGNQALSGAGNLFSNLNQNANATGMLGNAAANTALSAGQQGLNATTTGLTAANAPMSAFNQYASTIFGVPSNTTSANFTGAQGQNTSSKGKGFKL
jgi:hypothetical protein